ncbi:MAG: beta-lactamase family protein, partial [Pseudomonadota bacterium]|nr:beta-lactamase family protein [Pseudomonadota bacterium]
EANVEHRVPVRPETVFQSGSLGKQFAAAAIQLLAADGKLPIDDPVARWLAPVPATWNDITIRHLLTHTSGIREFENGTDPAQIDLRRDYTEAELVERARGLALDFEPGTQWNYSNTGYLLLGAIIRRASGRFYGDVLAERVFTPLGMTTTRVISESDIVANRAAGYRLVDGVLMNQEWVSPSLNTTADGSLYLTMRDLIQWDRGLREASVLDREQLAAAWTPVKLAGGDSYPYGFGWFIAEQRGRRSIEHSGSWQGFESQIVRLVDDDLSVMLLANLAKADLKRIARTVAGIVDASLALPDPTKRADDPDPSRSARTRDALRAWSEGTASPAMTDGFARVRDTSPRTSWFRQRVKEALAAQTLFHYVAEDDVRGRGIERFGSPVATILYLGLETPGETDRVVAYLDQSGAVAALSAKGF